MTHIIEIVEEISLRDAAQHYQHSLATRHPEDMDDLDRKEVEAFLIAGYCDKEGMLR